MEIDMGKIKDLRGIKIGEKGYVKDLVEIRKRCNNRRGETFWQCICDCGKSFVTYGRCIREGLIHRCQKCSRNLVAQKKIRNLIGYKFENGTEVLRFSRMGEKYSCWILKCVCGNEFEDTNCNIVHFKTAKLCHICRHKKINLIGQEFGYGCKVLYEAEKSPNSRARRWQCQCHCGKIWDIRQGNILRNETKECRKCTSKRCGLRNSGQNHYRYNPNLTDEERGKRDGSKTYKWRKAILNRDDYTCQVTHIKDNLVVHHLDGWELAKDKRFDVDNGITLNHDVHEKFHHIYGHGSNTKEQFEDFVKNYVRSFS